MRNRSIATYLALLAFLLNTLLPFYAVYQLPQNSDKGQISSLFGDKIFLCTAEGFLLVDREDLDDTNKLPAPHAQYQCVLCYVAAHSAAIKSVFYAYAAPYLKEYYRYPPEQSADVFVAEHRWQQRLTRSPPAFIA